MIQKIFIILSSKLCLSRLWLIQYEGMIHLSEHVKLAALIHNSYGQHTYIEEAMKSSQHASLSSQVLCPKH